MIVELNGNGGVGKYTIGRAVAELLGGRLIDNHVIYNPAFATTERGSPEFADMVRAVRDLTFDRASALPSDVPVILTIAPGSNLAWGREWQKAIRDLADRRHDRLFGVHLLCDMAENIRRLSTPERSLMRKLTDPAGFDDGIDRPALLDHCDRVLSLDVSSLSASDAAARIADWARAFN